VAVTRVALGCAPLAGLYAEVGEEQASATIDAAWEHGIRTFDTAPHYGAGLSERRVGTALRGRPRSELVLCTKVGRLLTEPERGIPDAHMFHGAPALERRFDFSRDGVLRSLEQSLERLGLDRLDVVHVHDPDEHMDQAIAEALPTLAQLRDEGVIGAVGAGMNHAEPLARIVREADVDCVLVAGRYTLLDQGAGPVLLDPCAERAVSVIAAAVFNSGILIDPAPGARYDYAPADDRTLRRALRIKEICGRHSVALPAAAMAFPLRHPAVACVLAGARSPAEVAENAGHARVQMPAALWDELDGLGLVPRTTVGAP
jgi:D-threo-aldose 1-dehydrogenase